MVPDRIIVRYAICCTGIFSKSGVIAAAIISFLLLFRSHVTYEQVYQPGQIATIHAPLNYTRQTLVQSGKNESIIAGARNLTAGAEKLERVVVVEDRPVVSLPLVTSKSKIKLETEVTEAVNSVGNARNDTQDVPKTTRTFPGCKKSSIRMSEGVDCKGIAESRPEAVQAMEEWSKNIKPLFDAEQLINNTSQGNCDLFRKLFCFPSEPLSREEAEFPLGYVLMASEEAEQTLRLFNNIYWPQNLYCLTYDTKSGPGVKALVESLSLCFDNVIVPSRHEEIHWGHHSVIQAAVNCLEAMHHRKSHGFKYTQIVTWSDMPLKTNLEMVKIFKVMNGSQDSQLKKPKQKRYRWKIHYLPYQTFPKWPAQFNASWRIQGFGGRFFVDYKTRNPPPPGNVTIYGGSFASSISRAFLDFIFTNSLPMRILEWMKNTHIPDEQFIPTIIHNTHIGAPGSYPGACVMRDNPNYINWRSLDLSKRNASRAPPKVVRADKNWMSRYQVWMDQEKNMIRCGPLDHRKWRHGSCVFGYNALSSLTKLPHLVAHKFLLSYEPAAYFCLTDRLNAKTYGDKSPLETDHFNLSYYSTLPAVIYQNSRSLKAINCSHSISNATISPN